MKRAEYFSYEMCAHSAAYGISCAIGRRSILSTGPFHRNFHARINYIAGCDVSGGRNDNFTAAISHRERDGKIVLDVLYERRTVEAFAKAAARYE